MNLTLKEPSMQAEVAKGGAVPLFDEAELLETRSALEARCTC